MTGLICFFESMEDPRVERTQQHKFIDIVVIAIAAVICGCEDWNEIELFGKSKKQWLSQFLELPNGIPSHDTFNRFFAALNPESLQQCFLNWIQQVAQITEGRIVSIDGKRLCGSGTHGKKAIVHMVSAWCNTNNMVLGQVKTDDKSNEIAAIPELLKLLNIKGCTVTIDAMGCQRDIADKIIEMGARIVLCDPHRAVVVGLERESSLRGIVMSSPDIRAGVALLIAALSAKGKSLIQNIEQQQMKQTGH